MNINATISVSSSSLNLSGLKLRATLDKALVPVHRAMAQQFHQCVMDNFGASGSSRPHAWAKLSPAYARKVRRDYATLFVTGRLKSAVKTSANRDRGRVSISKADVPYALAHQWGYGALPDRPYFPVRRDGSIVGSVQLLVVKSAELAIRAFLKGRQ